MARILSKAGARKTASASTRTAAPKKATAPAKRAAQPEPVAEAKPARTSVRPPAAEPKVKSEHGAVKTPKQAGDLKARFTELANATNQIKALKRALQKNFYEVGEILTKVQQERLFEVKGYGSFEAFVEREVDLGTQTCLSTARIFQTLQREAALAAGFERASAAVAALDGASEQRDGMPAKHVGMSAVPLHKQ